MLIIIFIKNSATGGTKMGTTYLGVVNVTPNSFSDGGKFLCPKAAINRAKQLKKDGANVLDIGGESTNPKAKPITADEELARVVPVLNVTSKTINVPISIDTYHSKTAEVAAQFGATILNATYGFSNPKILEVAKKYKMSCIINHCGSGEYTKNFLSDQFKLITQHNIEPSKIYLDPGIGFGKTFIEDFKIITSPQDFLPSGAKSLIGISRKRVTSVLMALLSLKTNNNFNPTQELFSTNNNYLTTQDFEYVKKSESLHKIKKLVNFYEEVLTPEEIKGEDPRDFITGVLCAVAVLNKIDALRVHNVKLVKKMVSLLPAF